MVIMIDSALEFDKKEEREREKIVFNYYSIIFIHATMQFYIDE